MEKITFKLIIAFVLIQPLFAQAQQEESKIKNVIETFFDGFSKRSIIQIRANVTPNFMLIEDGIVWTLDSVGARMQPLGKNRFSRENKFEFLKVETRGDMAWASYRNSATIKVNEAVRPKQWIESAVLVREKGEWKIRLLHSTRIEKQPKL